MRFEPVRRPAAPNDEVVIVGCGFSGALQAVNLHRHGGPRATVLERDNSPAKGLAYSTLHPGHLLNVRAARMSAFPDEPDHFVDWLKREGHPYSRDDFVPRALYGDYLRHLLDRAVRDSAGRIAVVRDEALALEAGLRVKVETRRSGSLSCDSVVLAIGNLPPHVPGGLDVDELGDLYRPNPWSHDVVSGLGDGDTVLLLGTGLTMIDVALLLHAEGFRGRIVALSRRGLVPHTHEASHVPPRTSLDVPSMPLSKLVREVRRRALEIGWQSAVDELRPVTQAVWRGLPTEARVRFLNHLRPWWDIHRHRIAPEVARIIGDMREGGQLEIAAGRVCGSRRCGDHAVISWKERGSGLLRSEKVSRIINCTGPAADIARTTDPLIRNLLEQGLVAPDDLNLGINVDPQGRTVRADGEVNDWLYAIGPITRGAFWEIVAVPDIRSQTWNLARRLSNAQWVGGEGL